MVMLETVINMIKKSYPAGSISMYAGSTAPTGYLLCDGSAVSRTTYADLFTAIGTTYGTGDGSTTFNLPNLKGKVAVGLNSADTSFDTLGETGGDKTHIHRQGGPASDGSGAGDGAISGPWNDSTFGRSSSGVTFANYSQIVSDGIGSSKTVYPFLTESTSSLQPYIVLNYIIKT